MATEFVGNVVPAPSVSAGTDLSDVEILKSGVGYRARGVLLKAGAGILPAGCLLGRVTSTKLWTVYDNSASDGTEVALGVLRHGVDTGTDVDGAKFHGVMVTSGVVTYSVLSGAGASAISAAVTDLNGRINSPMDEFYF